jgi:NarL family two-component system response regulator LiaR
MIVDEHRMVRRGLKAALGTLPDIVLTAEANHGLEAVQLCETAKPDVILMDLVMPVMDGVTATRLIRERFPQVQVIALTSYHNGELAREVLEAGAVGYLLKNVSTVELGTAIRTACRGTPALSPEVCLALVEGGVEEPERLVDLARDPQ